MTARMYLDAVRYQLLPDSSPDDTGIELHNNVSEKVQLR